MIVSFATSAALRVDVSVSRSLDVPAERAAAVFDDFQWRRGGGLPVFVQARPPDESGRRRRLVAPLLLEETLLREADREFEYAVTGSGLMGSDLVAGSHRGVGASPTRDADSRVSCAWAVTFEAADNWRAALWQRVTENVIDTAAGNLAAYVATPLLHEIDLALPNCASPAAARDAFLDFVWERGGGLPVPPPLALGGERERLQLPPGLPRARRRRRRRVGDVPRRQPGVGHVPGEPPPRPRELHAAGRRGRAPALARRGAPAAGRGAARQGLHADDREHARAQSTGAPRRGRRRLAPRPARRGGRVGGDRGGHVARARAKGATRATAGARSSRRRRRRGRGRGGRRPTTRSRSAAGARAPRPATTRRRRSSRSSTRGERREASGESEESGRSFCYRTYTYPRGERGRARRGEPWPGEGRRRRGECARPGARGEGAGAGACARDAGGKELRERATGAKLRERCGGAPIRAD